MQHLNASGRRNGARMCAHPSFESHPQAGFIQTVSLENIAFPSPLGLLDDRKSVCFGWLTQCLRFTLRVMHYLDQSVSQ